MKKKILYLSLCVMILALAAGCSKNDDGSIKGKHHAEIDMGELGVIKVELDADIAPITVANFIKLSKDGFYDGKTFHRIIPGFMIQGGSSDGLGMKGSEQTIKGEFKNNGVENSISHVRGTLSMARTNFDMNSASSQFFIVHEDSTFLDGDYAAFGKVTEGIEIVDKICGNVQGADENGILPAANQQVIKTVRIID